MVPASCFNFKHIAESYDNWYKTPGGYIYDLVEKNAIKRILQKKTEETKLLDIGCGTGHWSKYFVEFGFMVTGIDASPAMIKVARKKSIKESVFKIADAHELPFKDSEFDIAVIITTLEFVERPVKVIKEAVRCLKQPGGILIVGALNGLAEINRRRKQKSKNIYNNAKFFTPRELKWILSQFGKPHVMTTGFIWEPISFFNLSPFINKIGELFRWQTGAFIVGKLKL